MAIKNLKEQFSHFATIEVLQKVHVYYLNNVTKMYDIEL